MPEPKTSLFKHPAVFAFPAVVGLIEFIRMGLLVTLLPSLLLNLHYSRAVLGSVMSANILADNFTKSASGLLVDRHGPWPVLFLGSLLVFAGLLLIVGFHNNLLLLLLIAALIGVGASPTWPAAITGAIQVAGESKRATIISIISVVWLIGMGLGTMAMGLLIDSRQFSKLDLPLHSAYQAGFLLLIMVALVALTINLLGWLEWRRHPATAAVKGEQSGIHLHLKKIGQRLWIIKGLLPGMFIQTLALGILMPNLFPFVSHRLGFSESQYVTLLWVGGLVTLCLMIPIGHWADHLGTKHFLITGFALAAVAMFYLVFKGDAVNIWWIVAGLGLAYALIQPAWNALLAAAIPPAQRGALMGLFMSIEGLGFGIGPLCGGFLGAMVLQGHWLISLNDGLPFLVSGLLLTLMAIFYSIYPIHRYRFEG